MSVGLVGRNLFTWTNYKGYDPEVIGFQGNGVTTFDNPLVRIDSFGYPRYRTITGNIQIEF